MTDPHCWELALALARRRHSGSTGTSAAHDVFQVSTIAALAAGRYDGDTTYAEVMRHGDFGLGTFNALDGEMAALDGRYLHLHADGTVTPVDPSELTPFAAVTFFRADAEVDVDLPHGRRDLERLIDGILPDETSLYGIRVEGRFRTVATRTAARQHLPYPRLLDASATQVEQTLTDVDGTLVGFRAPASAQGRTVVGYHLHFVDTTASRGGHVLDFVLGTGRILLDRDPELHVELPEPDGSGPAPLAGDELARELDAAENQPARHPGPAGS